MNLGVSPPPGAVLVLHSLPLEFPLAVAFAEQLLTWKLGESSERSEDELDTVPSSVLLQVVELLGTSSNPEIVYKLLMVSSIVYINYLTKGKHSAKGNETLDKKHQALCFYCVSPF